MRLGFISHYDLSKGFGFITPLARQEGLLAEDYFFHVSALPKSFRHTPLEEGMHVSFEIGIFRGKTVAKFVRPVPPAEIGGTNERQN